MTADGRRGAMAAFLLWAGVVGTLTLAPAGPPGAPTLDDFFCGFCADRATADMLLNVLLFLPGGALMARLSSRRRAVVLGLVATVAIESLQTVIPGRYPSMADVVMNTGGMAAGAWWQWWPLPLVTARRLAALAGAAWLLPALFLHPLVTDAEQFGLWTPEFGDMAHYSGSVVDATVGDVPAPSASLGGRSAEVTRALRARRTVGVTFVVGRDPRTAAPVFGVFDADEEGNLLFGAVGDDLILRMRTVARVLHFDQPDVRWRDALADVQPGDTVSVFIHRDRNGVCFTLAGQESCGLAPGPQDGASFLLNLRAPHHAARSFLALAWPLGLGLLIGLPMRRTSAALAIGGAVALVGHVLAAWSPDATASSLHTSMLVLGALAGHGVRASGVGIVEEAGQGATKATDTT